MNHPTSKTARKRNCPTSGKNVVYFLSDGGKKYMKINEVCSFLRKLITLKKPDIQWQTGPPCFFFEKETCGKTLCSVKQKPCNGGTFWGLAVSRRHTCVSTKCCFKYKTAFHRPSVPMVQYLPFEKLAPEASFTCWISQAIKKRLTSSSPQTPKRQGHKKKKTPISSQIKKKNSPYLKSIEKFYITTI